LLSEGRFGELGIQGTFDFRRWSVVDFEVDKESFPALINEVCGIGNVFFF
jgi:hypothetical protein